MTRRRVVVTGLGLVSPVGNTVAEGWAWAFGGFSPAEDLVAAEAAARRDRRGLWAEPRPMSPAEWRRLHPPHR